MEVIERKQKLITEMLENLRKFDENKISVEDYVIIFNQFKADWEKEIKAAAIIPELANSEEEKIFLNIQTEIWEVHTCTYQFSEKIQQMEEIFKKYKWDYKFDFDHDSCRLIVCGRILAEVAGYNEFCRKGNAVTEACSKLLENRGDLIRTFLEK